MIRELKEEIERLKAGGGAGGVFNAEANKELEMKIF